MKDFTIQIHITGKCNCRCRHCYINEHANELSPNTINGILDQYKGLIALLEERKKETFRPLVNITGGEPFLYSNLDQLLQLIQQRGNEFVFRIATNGTLLHDDLLKRLQSLNLPFIQVSLDGNETIHDSIRGKGNFKEVVKALEKLYAYHINSRVSFTAHKDNYQSFKDVAKVCREHHVQTLWSDRYVLCEGDNGIRPLSPEETKEYVYMLDAEKKNPENYESG